MTRPALVSGTQPTGRLHLGNYLGALKLFLTLQDAGRYRCHFFVADLHSLTQMFTPTERQRLTLELLASCLAAGLDPNRSVIFAQSQVPAHSELAWILSTLTPMGELRRMIQFKEKSDDERGSAGVGLFTYPILMAADILLYDGHTVPVGEDQLQHLELTRKLVRKFNARFGKTFVEPQPLLTETPRVMSLDDPSRKMSKSRPAGCLFLDDPPGVIRTKVLRAATDSETLIRDDLHGKPGVSNLLRIYAALTEKPVSALEKEFDGKNYSEFKTALSEVIAGHFEDFRRKKDALIAKPAALKAVLSAGSRKAAQIAGKKITEVKRRVGIAP